MPPHPVVTYKNSRLTFRRKDIERLQPTEVFRVETEAGIFEMSKAEFLEMFPRVVRSKSWKKGYYNYPEVPQRAQRFRVDLLHGSGAQPYTPEEIEPSTGLFEGALRTITVNAYERNPAARDQCIKHYGFACSACNTLMSELYGEAACRLIHVHHLRPLSELSEEYRVDPIRDLRPVCPNCHAVMHMRTPPYTIEEVRDLQLQKGGS